MFRYRIAREKNGEYVYEIDTDGVELLHNPILNKGSAFTIEERKLFKLEGLLPPAVSTLDTQVARRWESFNEKTSDLEKYNFLRALQDRNDGAFLCSSPGKSR